ncbi:MAG: DUF1998 domain-containing protein, partial [Candidatus Sericytochromatia bacterium]
YAFPTDVVPLKILSSKNLSEGVDLNRELSRAISEYAPGSKIIANSRIYTSKALHKFPTQEFEQYYYYHCLNCGDFYINKERKKVVELKKDHISECSNDDNSQTKKAIYPKWGFAVPRNTKDDRNGSNEEKIKISTIRNRSSYSSDLFINEDSDNINLTDEKNIFINSVLDINLKYFSGYNMYRISSSSYNICKDCGSEVSTKSKTKKHSTPYGYSCNNTGIIEDARLLSIFDTDIVRFKFKISMSLDNFSFDKSFNLSLLYTLLESISQVMEIERKDLDGMYKLVVDAEIPDLILIDAVSGGAGHVSRLIGKGNENPKELIEKILLKSIEISNCKYCNSNTACYSCLFHYSNQKYQHLLNRGIVYKFLSSIKIR